MSFRRTSGSNGRRRCCAPGRGRHRARVRDRR
jgi:hypothetical protein